MATLGQHIELELAAQTAQAFARFLDLAHPSFIATLANSPEDAEAMQHATDMVRGQLALQGVRPGEPRGRA